MTVVCRDYHIGLTLGFFDMLMLKIVAVSELSL